MANWRKVRLITLSMLNQKPLCLTILICFLLVTIYGCDIGTYFLNDDEEFPLDEEFRSSLRGEIVYVHRDDLILNVYKISANGKNKRMLYHNVDLLVYVQ